MGAFLTVLDNGLFLRIFLLTRRLVLSIKFSKQKYKEINFGTYLFKKR